MGSTGWEKNRDVMSTDPEEAGRTMAWTREQE